MSSRHSIADPVRLRIGVIGGTGRLGRGLALRWARAGHALAIGSRDAARARERAQELSRMIGVEIAGDDNRAVAEACELAVLCVPYATHGETLRGLQPMLAGKILIDVTVPLAPPAVREVHLPAGQAAALEAQALLGAETRVAATLHHVSYTHLADPDHVIDSDVLVCADDPEARDTALALIGDLGMRGLDAGPLCNAVALEALTPVLLHLGRRYKGSGCGIRVTGLPGLPGLPGVPD